MVETKAITKLGLHLGATWFVIAATIVLVLVIAFLANFLMALYGLPGCSRSSQRWRRGGSR